MRAASIDDLLGTPARLAIMATVVDGRGWSFTELRDETGLADGNLHVQTGRLVKAGYLTKAKTTEGARSLTMFEVTARGREGFRSLVRQLRLAERADSTSTSERPRVTRRRREAKNDGSRVW
jgi:DNA-binding MarR family transcriptional regulator